MKIQVYNKLEYAVVVQCKNPENTKDLGVPKHIKPKESREVYDIKPFEKRPRLQITVYDEKSRIIKQTNFQTPFVACQGRSWIVQKGGVVEQKYGAALSVEDPNGEKFLWDIDEEGKLKSHDVRVLKRSLEEVSHKSLDQEQRLNSLLSKLQPKKNGAESQSISIEELMRRSQAVPMVEFKDLQFSVAEELGKGAGGVVYKVKWFATDVAVKQLRNIRDISPIAQAELIREANVMVQLRHPNIIQFFGITCDKGGVFSLVMEYMEKGSLYDILHNRKEELTAPSLHIKLYKDMISGLAYLHSNKILHRDLKSLNVLVTKDMQAKLADFGLSTLKSEITNEEFVGTPRWMAPEQIPSYKGGPVCHSEKADIYSYGIILWELLSRYYSPIFFKKPNFLYFQAIFQYHYYRNAYFSAESLRKYYPKFLKFSKPAV